MGTTSNLNLDFDVSGSTDWFAKWQNLFEAVDDMGKLYPFNVPVTYQPEVGTFFDSFFVNEDISIFAASVDASPGAPAGGNLIGDLMIGGIGQSKTFTLNGAATFQETVYGTPLNVNSGSRVGMEWTSVPSTPGRVVAVTLYFQKRALP